SISPLIRATDFSGTDPGTNSDSRAMRKLLCSSSGGTQRSSLKVKNTRSQGRSRPILANSVKIGRGVFPPESAIRNWPRSASAIRACSRRKFAASATKFLERITSRGMGCGRELNRAVRQPALFQITLMIIFGGIERGRGLDLRYDRLLESTAPVLAGFCFFGGGLLLGSVIINRHAILVAYGV